MVPGSGDLVAPVLRLLLIPASGLLGLIAALVFVVDLLSAPAYSQVSPIVAIGFAATSVAMLATQKNMARNGFTDPDRHSFVRADVVRWARGPRGQWDIILLDPPSYSASKGMEDSFEVQRDHISLIKDVSALLSPGGVLYFSNNKRGFTMERDALRGLVIEEITKSTIPFDFARNPRIHNAWRITKAG